MGIQSKLFLLLTPAAFAFFSPSSPPSAQPCFAESKRGCWNLGVEYNIPSAASCQQACLLWPQCQTFMYSPAHQKCHFCSDETLEWEGSVGDDRYISGPRTCLSDDIPSTVTDVLQSALSAATSMCTDTIERDSMIEPFLQADMLGTATTINRIVRFKNEYREETFPEAFQQAVYDATSIIRSSKCTSACDGVLHLQLQNMVLSYKLDGGAAFPFDQTRTDLVNDFRVMVADNGWLSEESLDAIYDFYDSLPDHLKIGLYEDAPFAVQYLPETYSCDNSVIDIEDVTNVTYKIAPAMQFKGTRIQSFPSDTPDIPASGDYLMTLVKDGSASRFYQVVIRDRRLSSMLNSLYLKSKEGSHTKHFLGMEEAEFYERNPREIFSHQIGRQYMFSSSSQLNLAIARWGTFGVDSSVSVSDATKCDEIDRNLGSNITSRLGCRKAARDEDSCTGSFFMWDGVGRCSCCSADASFLEDEAWTIYQYRENTSPQVPTPLPLSWWLLNVDILANRAASISTFYEYDRYGLVVPLCVNIFRDDLGRIETIEVPGCGLLDFSYSESDEYLVDSVTDNALACKPDLSLPVCEFDSTSTTATGNTPASSAGERLRVRSSLIITCAISIFAFGLHTFG